MKRVGEIMDRTFACRHGEAFLARYGRVDGSICYWCPTCRRIVSREKGFSGLWIAEDHPDLENVDVDRLEVVQPGGIVWRRCEGPCQEITRTELHHFAPKVLFGEDDAETWPALYLCRGCHEAWHRQLTPGLCTAYDPVHHALMLRRFLKRAQLEALMQALRRALQGVA